jgi:hypothetical protein
MDGLLSTLSPRSRIDRWEPILNELDHWKQSVNMSKARLTDLSQGTDPWLEQHFGSQRDEQRRVLARCGMSREAALRQHGVIVSLLERAHGKLAMLSQALGRDPDEFNRTAMLQVKRLDPILFVLQQSIDWDCMFCPGGLGTLGGTDREILRCDVLLQLRSFSEQLLAEFVVKSKIGFVPQGAPSLDRGGGTSIVENARVDAVLTNLGGDSRGSSTSALSEGLSVGEFNDVIDDTIEHADEPAVVPPDEAAVVASDLQNSLLQWNADSIVFDSDAAPPGRGGSDQVERVVLLQYTRSPEELDSVLAHELEHLIHLLREAGHDWRLPSGAKVITFPQHFRAVVATMTSNQYALRPCHVIVTEGTEGLVHNAVSSLRSRLNVRLRQDEVLGYVASDGAPILVQRTFINIPATAMLASQSVTQSTTEVHSRAVNPRRPQVTNYL